MGGGQDMIVNRYSEDVNLKGEKISSCEDEHWTQYLANQSQNN